jgi:hypothetical protein
VPSVDFNTTMVVGVFMGSTNPCYSTSIAGVRRERRQDHRSEGRPAAAAGRDVRDARDLPGAPGRDRAQRAAGRICDRNRAAELEMWEEGRQARRMLFS